MSGWCVALAVPRPALALIEGVLEPLGGALVADGPDARDAVSLRLYLAERPDAARLRDLVAAAAVQAGVSPPGLTIEPLPAVDWVAESQKALPPIRAGRFWLHGAHVQEAPPPGAIALRVEANAAFGTGRHESTRGCLLALGDLAQRRNARPRRALDMGCGSGVLAMAIARFWHCPVLAIDNDPASVAVARENVRLNGVGKWVRVEAGEGYLAAALQRAGRFDLIVANILAGPLIAMAGDLAAHLAPGGRAILAGLLRTQERAVTARHRAAGLRLDRRIRLGEWSILQFSRRRARSPGQAAGRPSAGD